MTAIVIRKQRMAATKVISFVVLFLGLIAASTTAVGSEGPILKRASFPGHIQPEWNRVETNCEVYETKVVIDRSLMGVSTTEIKEISFESGSSTKLRELIATAANATFVEHQLPTDGPFVNYFATQEDGTSVTLDATDPQWSIKRVNQSFEATSLKLILDMHCGEIPHI